MLYQSQMTTTTTKFKRCDVKGRLLQNGLTSVRRAALVNVVRSLVAPQFSSEWCPVSRIRKKERKRAYTLDPFTKGKRKNRRERGVGGYTVGNKVKREGKKNTIYNVAAAIN